MPSIQAGPTAAGTGATALGDAEIGIAVTARPARKVRLADPVDLVDLAGHAAQADPAALVRLARKARRRAIVRGSRIAVVTAGRIVAPTGVMTDRPAMRSLWNCRRSMLL